LLPSLLLLLLLLPNTKLLSIFTYCLINCKLIIKDSIFFFFLVKRCIPLPKKLYKRTRSRLRTIDEVEEYFPGFKAFIDATEQEIPRPKNKRKRKSYYSGKKKKHTVKTQYMVNSEGLILHKTGHDRGRIHDYEVFKNKHPATPPQVENVLDLGYMGVKNDFPTVKSVLPLFRKKRKSELSDEEKRHNRKHSKLRIIVEHTVSRIKKFGIMGTKFRNRLRRYDNVSSIVSGLVNFRIMMRTNGMLL
jgi:DDE superfamily endonuclease